MIPYSPSLPLKQSYFGLYKIYVLKNPISKEIFYVGQTKAELQSRLAGHISDDKANLPKQEYIKNILDLGDRPIIQEIETIKATCYIDQYFVDEREAYWIKHYRSIGCNLLNVAQSGSNEYKTYLASIKAGQSSYQYYFCGETFGGIKVYDEERMLADGFRLPRNSGLVEGNNHTYKPNSSEYNPFENPAFLKRMGYGKIIEVMNTSYWPSIVHHDPCYKDTDPDYYDDDY